MKFTTEPYAKLCGEAVTVQFAFLSSRAAVFWRARDLGAPVRMPRAFCEATRSHVWRAS